MFVLVNSRYEKDAYSYSADGITRRREREETERRKDRRQETGDRNRRAGISGQHGGSKQTKGRQTFSSLQRHKMVALEYYFDGRPYEEG